MLQILIQNAEREGEGERENIKGFYSLNRKGGVLYSSNFKGSDSALLAKG
jgi:hypothetical protein